MCILIEAVLSSDKSNSLEHLHTQSLSGDRTNRVDCVLLLTDEVSPSKKNVSAFVNILIVLSSPDKS